MSKAEPSDTTGAREEYESTPTLPHVVHTVRKVKAAITLTAGEAVVDIADRLPTQDVATWTPHATKNKRAARPTGAERRATRERCGTMAAPPTTNRPKGSQKHAGPWKAPTHRVLNALMEGGHVAGVTMDHGGRQYAPRGASSNNSSRPLATSGLMTERRCGASARR